MSSAVVEERSEVAQRSLAGAAARQARIDQLVARGAELSGVVASATAGLVEVIAEALADDLWCGYGILSPEHWVALRFGVSRSHARRLVASARALVDLPECRAAFGAGAITEDHVWAIARAEVGPVHDGQAAELAREATVSQLSRGLSLLPPPPPEPTDDAADVEDDPAPTPDPEPRPQPQTSFGGRDDGLWGLRSTLDVLDGALVEKALLAARDQLFRARHGDDPAGLVPGAVSWSDALVHLARVGLEAMDPATDWGTGRHPSDRYVINLHLRADAPETARIHLGPALPAHLRTLATCDARVRAWMVDQVGNVGLGRTQHCVDPKLRAVVEHRDGGCVVPGCGATRWLQVHHLRHWEHGGPTETSNLAAVCGGHHHAAHAGDLTFEGNPDLGTLVVRDRTGHLIGPSPPTPPGQPPGPAARALGLPPPQYRTRSGERADWNYMIWHHHPHPDTDPP
jgi:hypothetical protein